jgi:hypothetical protein
MAFVSRLDTDDEKSKPGDLSLELCQLPRQLGHVCRS